MVLGKGDIHMQKDEVGPYFILHTKIHPKLTEVLNVKAKTILKENTGVNFPDLGLGQSLRYNT